MIPSKVRKPVVAGRFYPLSAKDLNKQIKDFSLNPKSKIDAISCMLPHAGYVYSGRVAVETVSSIQIKERVILLGPNHTGNGESCSIMTEGSWQTPLGIVNIDSIFAKKLLSSSRYLKEDSIAHRDEHSIEVELPILQYFKEDFKIVPIAFMTDNINILKEIGKEIAGAISQSGQKSNTIIIASSDMTHYESQSQAEEKDRAAINAMLKLDENKLLEEINRLDITMCGWAPAIVMLSAAKSLGAKSGKLVKYQTSADITKDTASVVGYAGMIFN